MHFNGVVYYPNDDGGLQMVLIPWSRSVGFRMPVSVWNETIEHYYPNTAWVAPALADPRGARAAARRTRACDVRRHRARSCWREPRCLSALEQLVDSLLWEGYALYPYTPGATKNATPTPFGIVYPPVYASGAASTFDHLELRCVLGGIGRRRPRRRGALPGRRR